MSIADLIGLYESARQYCVRFAEISMEMYEEKIESLEVIPVIEGRPVPGGKAVGELLSIISLKDPSQDSDPDRVVKRNSFRDLLRPNVAKLDWASQNSSLDQVYCMLLLKRCTVTANCTLLPLVLWV